MKRQWTALLLALWMLVCAGCGGQGEQQIEEPPEDDLITQPPAEPQQPTPLPEPVESEPEPEPEPLVWSTEPVLTEQETPGSYQGLELPIQGATGYSSIALPLWASPEDCTAARQALAAWEQRQAEAAAAREAAAAQPEPEPEPVPVPEEEPIPQDTEAPASDEQGETGDSVPDDGETPPDTEEEASVPELSDLPEELEDGIELEAMVLNYTPPEEIPVPEPEPEPEPRPSLTEGALAILPAGTAMTVLQESGGWWKVQCTAGGSRLTGWIEHRYCFVNLPDVIPSIIFNATNAYSSRFVSCGKTLEGVTGEQLYTGKTFNARLGEEEFMMPVLYSMAFRLYEAQQAALREGNCLVLYEGYRPQDTQMQVANALRTLMGQDSEVKTAITSPPWGISWFIATSTSNHQWGYAVDVSLARVRETEIRESGGYAYTRVREYEEYEMPTPIHELSPAAATFTTPVGPNSATAWKNAELSSTMAASESALGLQGYCTGAGLSPLASEWWHFNDLASRASVLDNLGSGGFEITACLSEAP